MKTVAGNEPGGLAIAYDDSHTGAKKFAYEGKSGWVIQTVDNGLPTGGGRYGNPHDLATVVEHYWR